MAVFKSWNREYRRTRGGFTLLEVLIAFAILAVAMTALMQAFSQGLRSLEAAEDYATAAMLARSKMAEVGPIIPIEEGEHTGDFENGWQWRVVVFPYAGEENAPAELQALHVYDVQVAVVRDELPLAELRSLRVGTSP
jgi:general secretion pathway protein I